MQYWFYLYIQLFSLIHLATFSGFLLMFLYCRIVSRQITS
nr:MAG TPA: hypothetical protein [Caudoviricetes sp.]